MNAHILRKPIIHHAVQDIRKIIQPVSLKISSAHLFGSTVLSGTKEARDIDFFVGYSGSQFEHIRDQFLMANVGRKVIVENVEATYTNHPEWPREDPLPIHIILYRPGISRFSDKLQRAYDVAIDVTPLLR